MKNSIRLLLSFLFTFCLSPSFAQYIQELNRLTSIDQLAVFSDNSLSRQLSSYDTTGGNDDGFSGRYSFIREENGKQLIADLKGPGIIQRIWTPTPAEDTIQFYFDGETKARIEIPFIDLFTGKQFPFIRPVVGNEVGGYYCYLPIPYSKSCKIYFKGKMQFFQIQYIETADKRVQQSFSPSLTDAEKKALEAAALHWKTHPSQIASGKAFSADSKRSTKRLLLKPGESTSLFELNKGGRILGLRLSPKASFNQFYKDVLLKITWDGEKQPAVFCPLTDFFGYAFGNPAMKSLPLGVHNGIHYSRLPMPFDRSAKIEIEYLQHESNTIGEIPVDVEIEYNETKRRKEEGKFYAVWKREKNPAVGKPYQILQYEGRGHYVGTILQAQGLDKGMTIFFEGDDRAYIDGKLVIHGTGSEDYFNGGWYALPDRWDQAYSLPTHGSLEYSIPLARTGGYRFYVTDKLSFRKDFLLNIEHGPENNAIPVDYVSLALFYADAPPALNAAINKEMLTRIESPATNVYLVDLLAVKAISNTAGLSRTFVQVAGKQHEYNVYKLEGDENAFAKFELDIAREGSYKLYATYIKGPGSGKFDVNQRQIPVKNGIDAYSTSNTLVEQEYLGSLYIEKGTNTLTFVLKDKPAGAEKNTLMIQSLYLEAAE